MMNYKKLGERIAWIVVGVLLFLAGVHLYNDHAGLHFLGRREGERMRVEETAKKKSPPSDVAPPAQK